MKKTKRIPIFFSCDDNYIPFLAAAVRSLADNAKSDAQYELYVLNDGLDKENAARIKSMEGGKIRISFIDVAKRIAPLLDRLRLRDYYTFSIYYRLFIPDMFPEFDKAIYLDSDVIVLSDIAGLYDIPLGSNLLGAVPDAIVASEKVFRDYSALAVGVPYERYFNSGVLLMNLSLMREYEVEARFSYLLGKYGFNTICPDQDYLNVICDGKVKYLGVEWDKMSLDRNFDGVPKLIHFNMFDKPWHYDNVPYEEYFWQYAEKTEFYDEIKKIKASFGKEDAQRDIIGGRELRERALSITYDAHNFRNTLYGTEEEENENRQLCLANQA